MYKMIISIFIITSSLFASSSKYLNQKDYSNNNFRIFIGTQVSYSYFKTNKLNDNSMYSYGLYTGLPIFKNYDLILKRKKSVVDEFYSIEDSLTLTIPLTSRLTRKVYVGLEAGKGTLNWDNSSVNKYSLKDKKTKGNFFGISLGKKFKYTRHYYVRVEIDYKKYNYVAKSLVDDIKGNQSFGFNYSFEYRF